MNLGKKFELVKSIGAVRVALDSLAEEAGEALSALTELACNIEAEPDAEASP